MKPIYNKIFLEHDTGMHPENKRRLEVLKLRSNKVLNGERYLYLVHSKKYIKRVKDTCSNGGALDIDTFVSRKSYEASVYAVGATIQASRSGDFAFVRPPGHHAYPDKSSGFCVFNNLAISVKKLISEGKRVLIFDFDGHLGDGVERIFYDSDKVLYFSTHQYPAFPGHGFVDEVGSGKGKGYTINVALPPGAADDLLFKSFRKFLPIMKRFEPDVVAISAGFDGYSGDLLLDLNYSIGSFYKIGKFLRDNFNFMYATFEGGYNLEALPKCVLNFLDGINGRKQRYKDKITRSSLEVRREYDKRLKILEKELLRYWK